MTAAEVLTLVAQIAGLTFVVASMLAMGLSLALGQILAPLKNTRFVVLALVANFILVPAWAYLLKTVIPLDQSLQIGLIVLACAAGAPFLPKLVQGAKGDIGLGVGLMVLLMVVTIGFMPLVLPLLLPGVEVNPWDIAKSLIVLMLIPLALGLLARSNWPEDAAHWQPLMNKVSSLALLILLVVGLGLNVSSIIDLIGSNGLIALVLFYVGALIAGIVLGGRDRGVSSVMGLGTAQRNVSAAILVTAQNFSGTPTLSFVLVAAILGLLILLPTAKRLGTRAQAADNAGGAEPQPLT